MKTSILWNGFEIKKGDIKTEVGNIPYLFYLPYMSDQTVNIALHGEGSNKEEWLSFNSTIKLGNLLKESIKKNSPFIAFDLYGHGEWLINNHNFNTQHLSSSNRDDLVKNSIMALQEAIPSILKAEGLTDNPVSLIAYSLGCSVALALKLKITDYKTILISPYKSSIGSNCENFYILRGKDDKSIPEDEFKDLYNSLPKNSQLDIYKSGHEIPESWINKVKDFIYS